MEELKAYLGFMIVMGINRLPEIRDYWSTDEKMHNTFIASRITRDRFEQISRYLHLVNNTSLPSRNQPGYHRLQKVLPIITHMKQKCKENYNPHPQNSVDEAMIGYKGKNNNYHNFKCSQIHIYMHTGRSSMIQYMPMKPTKRGFKVWVRADSVNGYFCDFEVYTGRATDGETTSDFGLGERVVLELTECLRGGHYQIYCDNYFSTCRLFDTLSTHQLYGCGTARPTRRQFPETLKHVRPGRGEHVFRQRGDLVASVWMDKKPVNMLSTLAQADVTHTIQKRQRDGTRAPTQCPDAVVLYNRYMAGVDKGDQYQSVVLLLHPELFSTCPLACRTERDVLTAHSAETPQGGRTHPSTVVNALTTPHCASLGLGTAQTASGSGTNISCNTFTLYAICVILFCSLCVPFVSCSCTQCTCMCVVTLFYVVHACMHIVCLLGFVMCVLSCWARSVDLHVVPDGNSTLCAG